MLSPGATSRKVEEKAKHLMEKNEVEGNKAKILITLYYVIKIIQVEGIT